MFKDLKPYSAVQPSDLPWLPLVPAHWQLVRAKDVLRPVDIRSATGDETLLTVSSARGVVPRSSANVTMFKAASYAGHKLCWPGDLVINSLWAWGRGLGVSEHHGIISTAYGVYRPRDTRSLNAGFLHELVRSEPFHWELQVRSKGVWISRLQLTDDSFLRAPLPLPPGQEQAAIVTYLAHANRRIDQAIAAKRKLIRLLEEQKQVIVNQAITRGLDPQVKMRDSGISWLGEIPAHWEVAPLRRYWSVTDCKHLTVPFVAEGFPLASVTQAQRFYLNLVDAKHTTEENYQSLVEGGRGPRRGDLIYCRNVGVGSAAVVATDEPFAMGQDVCLLRSRDQDPVFLNHYLRSRPMAIQLERLLVGSTFRRINVSQIRALQLLVPSLPEQRQIVAHLNVATEDVEAAITQSQAEIDLLREFRTRLTADVVTGQVDVREIAASLPEVSPAELADLVNESMDYELDELAEEFAEDATLV